MLGHRCPSVLRCACGFGARGVLRSRRTPEQYARPTSSRIERFLSGQPPRVRRRSSPQEMQAAAAELDFEARRVASRRASTRSDGLTRQAARGKSTRNLDADVVGPVPRGDRRRRARAHGARGPHHQHQRVRARPRQRRARPGPAAHVPAALLRRHHLHPARGARPRYDARGRRRHGGRGSPAKLASAHGAKVRICASAERGEKAELVAMAEHERQAHAHALQGAHELRRQAHQRRARCSWRARSALDAPPMRIECFDISTNHGTYTRSPPWWCSPTARPDK